MKHKWFWMTLGFWLILGFGATTWALIHSPSRSNFEPLSRFEGLLNDLSQEHQIEVSTASLEECLAETDQAWKTDGWDPLSASLNLAPLLLGLEPKDPYISDHLWIGLYGKRARARILGLWVDHRRRQTYRWTAELNGLFSAPKIFHVRGSLPLDPPKEAFQIFHGKAGDLRFTTWSMPIDPEFESRFKGFFSSQGFSGKRLGKGKADPVYLLRKDRLRAIALLGRESGRDQVCLAFFP